MLAKRRGKLGNVRLTPQNHLAISVAKRLKEFSRVFQSTERKTKINRVALATIEYYGKYIFVLVLSHRFQH